MITPLAVVGYVEKFDTFTVKLPQKFEFLAQGGGHPQLRAIQMGIAPGGMGSFNLGSLQGVPV